MPRPAALAAVVGLVGLLALPAAGRPPRDFPPPRSVGPVATYGAKLQRSMTLLATSSARKRNTVRVLFYGQSITDQEWTREVAEDLRRRFPISDLVIENRAIPGFASNRLVKTAEADLYPFYPDLVVFHVYGAGPNYEAIIRRVRERTTADVLMATDHLCVVLRERVDEETDPAKLTEADGPPWANHVFLPGVARKYDAELADVRAGWKRYLTDHNLRVPDLLCDPIHLNDRGCYLMAELVKPYLRHRPELPDDDWRDRVTTYEVGTDVEWKNGRLVVPFDGNRVDLVCKEVADPAAPVAVRVDGRKPSEFPELYVPTRTELLTPRARVPALMRVGAAAPRVVEDWQMEVWATDPARRHWRFKVTGSVTGPDGEGDLGGRFVSKSGRVAIDPGDFNIDDAMLWAGRADIRSFVVGWSVVPYFSDTFAVPGKRNPFGETVVTVAQGLTNGRHTLEVAGGPDTPVAAVRVYRPPLGRE